MIQNNTKEAELLAVMAQTRKNFYALIRHKSLEELNHIPKGFNNNLIWNFGHILATQQLLCYKLSNKSMQMPDELVNAYRKGSVPSGTASQEEYEGLLALSKFSLSQLAQDLASGSFKEYQAYETSFGLTLASIQEAISFNALHEAMHLGYALALNRAVTDS